MVNYELTVVLPGKSTPAKKKKVKADIEKLIKTFKGKVSKFDDWGEINLVYKIAKNETGIFLHFGLELDAESVKEIPAKLKTEEDIIRYLLIKNDK